MARGKRTSSEKRSEIITEKIKNPDLSCRDISQKTGINPNTVNMVLNNEMPEVMTKCDDKVTNLVKDNLDIITESNKLVKQYLGQLPMERYSDLKLVSAIGEEKFKQNQLLTGQATENVQGIGDILKQIQGVKNEN